MRPCKVSGMLPSKPGGPLDANPQRHIHSSKPRSQPEAVAHSVGETNLGCTGPWMGARQPRKLPR